jgi:hypothetical protein
VLPVVQQSRVNDFLDRADQLRHVLAEQRHSRAWKEFDPTVVRLLGAREQAHERRLAGAIAAHQADAFASVNRARYAVKQRRTVEGNANVVEGDLGHPEIFAASAPASTAPVFGGVSAQYERVSTCGSRRRRPAIHVENLFRALVASRLRSAVGRFGPAELPGEESSRGD